MVATTHGLPALTHVSAVEPLLVFASNVLGE